MVVHFSFLYGAPKNVMSSLDALHQYDKREFV